MSLLVPAFRKLKHPTGRGLHEPTKVAVNYGRALALIRALIHLIPFGFALFEIIINWNTYYVGTSPYSIVVYQIIAKAHEVLIQGSIATTIFSAIRNELIFGKGLPFGFLFSGLYVTQISYLWSMELWGAVTAKSLYPIRRVALAAFFIGGILLAATVGPASAVLLIPRQQLWPAGRTHIWINATTDQVWPMRMNGSSVPDACSTVGTEGSNACPASEWYAVYNWLLTSRKAFRAADEGRYHIVEDNYPPNSTAKTQSVNFISGIQLWGLSSVNLTADTGHGSTLSDNTDGWQSITSNYSQANSIVQCDTFDLLTTSASDYVALPFLPALNPESAISGHFKNSDGSRHAYIELPNLIYSDLFEGSRESSQYRVQWIELPENLFNGSSIGAAISLPNNSKNMIFCNIAAGWTSSSLALELRDGGVGPADSTTNNPDKGVKIYAPIRTTGVPNAQADNPALQNWPDRVVNISQSWARYLNPTVEEFNTSLLNLLLQQPADRVNNVGSYSNVLAALTTNGLARTAWDSTLQGDVKTVGPNGEGGVDGSYWLRNKGDVFKVDPETSQEWVTLRVDSTLEGYAYNTLTEPPRIAIAIMMIYCISSNRWDTIAELTALAINSRPTAALRNTCAGISELHIFKLPVRILVSKDDEGEGEHLELVFGERSSADEKKGKSDESTIKPNRTYGTLPRGMDGKGGKKE
ncbi:MAG: hypothetical protein Q9168_005411 [Polycauliona sp. 1 TL-2023]